MLRPQFCKSNMPMFMRVSSTVGVRNDTLAFESKLSSLFSMSISGMINRNVATLNIMHLTIFDEVVALIAEWPDFAYYTEKLRKFRPHLIERERQSFDTRDNEFNTLIHGDFWFTNLMLKYDGDKLDNVALIDFQFNCWTSPAIDLHYFLNTSVNEKLQMRHQPELVQYYHKKLTTMLKRLNYQKHIPTLLEFQIQYLARSIWGKQCSNESIITV